MPVKQVRKVHPGSHLEPVRNPRQCHRLFPERMQGDSQFIRVAFGSPLRVPAKVFPNRASVNEIANFPF